MKTSRSSQSRLGPQLRSPALPGLEPAVAASSSNCKGKGKGKGKSKSKEGGEPGGNPKGKSKGGGKGKSKTTDAPDPSNTTENTENHPKAKTAVQEAKKVFLPADKQSFYMHGGWFESLP